jgi:hypothetical protein
MNATRFTVACLLLCALPLTAGAQPGVLKQIVPGVWFREGEMDLSHCNNVAPRGAPNGREASTNPTPSGPTVRCRRGTTTTLYTISASATR